jgi:hypothetical protein
MRVHIAIPVHHDPAIAFMLALLPLQRGLADAGIATQLDCYAGDSLITRARNELTQIFLSSECTHQLWLDADLEFCCNDIVRMAHARHALAAAPYPKKTIDWTAVRAAALAGPLSSDELAGHAAEYVINCVEGDHRVVDGWMPVQRAGTGCMMVAREVYEAIERRDPDQWYSNGRKPGTERTYDHWRVGVRGHEYVSEDWAFCDAARSLGYSVMLDLQAQIGHVGTHTFRGNIATQYKIRGEAAE